VAGVSQEFLKVYEAGLFAGKTTEKLTWPTGVYYGRHLSTWLAGVFEQVSYLTSPKGSVPLKFTLLGVPDAFLEQFIAFSNAVPTTKVSGRYATFEGPSAIDAVMSVYNLTSFGSKERRHNAFSWCTKSYGSGGLTAKGADGEFRYQLLSKVAKPPVKHRASDSGYDLTLINHIKTNDWGVEFYGTGVCVSPPHGYYFQLVGRSSITKMGKTLANNVGIIDRSYRGEIIVPLINLPLYQTQQSVLQLPCTVVQIIPVAISHFIPVEAELTPSNRNKGAFGSTDEQTEGKVGS